MEYFWLDCVILRYRKKCCNIRQRLTDTLAHTQHECNCLDNKSHARARAAYATGWLSHLGVWSMRRWRWWWPHIWQFVHSFCRPCEWNANTIESEKNHTLRVSVCECFTKRVPHASHADCLPSCVNKRRRRRGRRRRRSHDLLCFFVYICFETIRRRVCAYLHYGNYVFSVEHMGQRLTGSAHRARSRTNNKFSPQMKGLLMSGSVLSLALLTWYASVGLPTKIQS